MAPIITTTNQYLGINAHLHSHFLHREPEGWEEFHSSHITDLTRAMNSRLPEMGYIARQERSLQIRHFFRDNRDKAKRPFRHQNLRTGG